MSFFPLASIAPARTSNTVLKDSGESGHLVLLLILRKGFQLFTMEYNVSSEFVICGLIMLRYISSILAFLGVFNHKWIPNFVHCFFCICSMVCLESEQYGEFTWSPAVATWWLLPSSSFSLGSYEIHANCKTVHHFPLVPIHTIFNAYWTH